MLRKMTASILMVLLVTLLVQPALAATTTGSPLLDKLAEVETALYGSVQPGALLNRIQRVETDLNGKTAPNNEAILVRVDRLSGLVARGGTSLIMKMNAAEWMLFQTQSTRVHLLERLKQFEEKIYGQANTTKSISQRIDDIMSLVWPGGVLNTAQVPVPPGTRVRVKLLTELSSTSTKENDQVQYQVINDVKIDDKIVIPIGALGAGTVKQVKKSGPFGQPGSITIEFGSVTALDGTGIALTYQQAANDKAGQQDLAAGASLGGMVLLGPLGLAAGYLVQGKAETIQVGTEITIEVKEAATVQGLSLLPVK